ncbi:hypothetical protein [Sphingobium xenophagum]|uniref:hypothetical protein n=1 Tax=Sphingobium xenophagum TaxID=121428 RepID=UPI00036A8B33|nr:hypothetical protein [Sphingobium xenophagum]
MSTEPHHWHHERHIVTIGTLFLILPGFAPRIGAPMTAAALVAVTLNLIVSNRISAA